MLIKKLSSLFLTLICFFCTRFYGQELDRYGGYQGIKGASKGSWSVEKIKDRYWFVTPEGNALYVLGVNHITPNNTSEERKAQENLKKWNFNSCGKSTNGELLSKYPGFIPFSLHNSMHWLPADRFGYVDVFDPDFESYVENTIRERVEIGKKYKGVIGYVSTDTPRYDLDISRKRRGSDWVSFIRALPLGTSGKQAYVDFLKKKYGGDFEKFQQSYRISDMGSFDVLYEYNFQNLELTRSAIRQDDDEFLAIILKRIYHLTRTNFDKFAPSAIVLSDTFKMHDHPKEILKLAGEYFDAISIQAGPTKGPDTGQGPDESEFNADYWKSIYELTGKPILLADHGFSFATPEYPRTLWHQFPSEKNAADFYDRYLRQVIEVPYIMGYLKCQYKNRYDPLRTLLKQGILKEDGSSYEILEKQIAKTNARVIEQFLR